MKKFGIVILAGLVVLSMGAFVVYCGGGSDGGCSSNADCETDEYCDLTTNTCKPIGDCDPVENCQGRCGGDDGCGGTCPNNCPAGEICDTDTWTCVDCVPDCTDIECGPDPVCGEICGTCDAGETCEDGTCVECIPDCTDKECGPDGCDGSCGTCDAGYTCVDGQCESGVTPPGDECPNGVEDCPDPWDVCLEGGGMTYCTSECVTDDDCGGEPNCCYDFGGGSYCWDESQCPGESDVGEPCPIFGLNDSADACMAGLSCLGVGPDADNLGDCTTADDCISTVGENLNPDCVDNACGGSFCAEPCPNGEPAQCPDGFFGQEVNNTCFCVPESGVEECSDPINNVGCADGEKCVPYQGGLVCTEEGTQAEGEPCGTGACGGEDCYCQEGLGCYAFGEGSQDYTCIAFCDAEQGTGCQGCDYCMDEDDDPATPWGICYPLDCCTMESSGSECAAGDTCIPMDDECTIFACFPIYGDGAAEGEPCEYSNSCNNGLLCAGTPGACELVCNSGVSCTDPEVCVGVDGCDMTPADWGICGTE